MAQRADNWVEKIAKIIPGYSGYKAREDRRNTDRALRAAIVAIIDDRRTVVDRVLAECSRQMKFDSLETLEALRRRLQLLADLVRYAPVGYAGFFDTFEVKEADLDAIYAHDLRVREVVQELGSKVASLDAASPILAESATAALVECGEVERVVRARDTIVTGM